MYWTGVWIDARLSRAGEGSGRYLYSGCFRYHDQAVAADEAAPEVWKILGMAGQV